MGKAAQRKRARRAKQNVAPKKAETKRWRLWLGLALTVIGLSLIAFLAYPYVNLYLGAVAPTEKASTSFHLTIPSVKIDAPVYEGVSQECLIKGIGHNPGSKHPGEKGNCILEGHNLNAFWPGGFSNVKHPERYFATLHLVKPGAEVLVDYKKKRFRYRVTKVEQLKSGDPALRVLTTFEQLTLVTCSPGIITLDRLKVTCMPAK